MSELKRKPPDPANEQNPAHNKRKLIVNEEANFYNELAKDVEYAWENRNLEHPLYKVFQTICGKICETVRPEGYPNVSVSTVAQYPFGGRVSVKGPSQKPREMPSEIPDFVRLFVVGGQNRLFDKKGKKGGVQHELIDLFEIKPLNGPDEWDSPKARAAAAAEIPKHVFQVYSEAMAAFIRNPEWKELYAWLIIGIYYTQFYWKRPEGDIRPPVYFNFSKNVPCKIYTPKEHQALLDLTEAAIEECKARKMPQIMCWNEPLFTFPDYEKNPHALPLKLSPQLLWSMRVPLKDEGTKFQPSWLSAPSKMPSVLKKTNTGTTYNEDIESVLRHLPLNALQDHKHELQRSLPSTPASVEARKRQGLVNKDEADWVPYPKRKIQNKGKGKACAIQPTPSRGGKKAQLSRQPKAVSILAAIQAVGLAPGTAAQPSEGEAAQAGPVGEHETPIRPIELPLQGAAGGESSAMGSSHGENISAVFPRFPVNRSNGEEGEQGNGDETEGESED